MSLLDRLGDTAPLPRIEDPRARFYLDNYRTIRTWAALEREAVALLVGGLLDLAPVFEADGERLGQRLQVAADERASRVILRRPEWAVGVGIGLEWTRAIFDRRDDVWLYAGLQHDAGEISEELRRHLIELAGAAQPALGSAWTSGTGAWILWRWIRPDGEPLDEQALFSQARREVWRCWEATAPTLDGLLLAEDIPPESPQ